MSNLLRIFFYVKKKYVKFFLRSALVKVSIRGCAMQLDSVHQELPQCIVSGIINNIIVYHLFIRHRAVRV